jgi:phospholipase/carboxylesterase
MNLTTKPGFRADVGFMKQLRLGDLNVHLAGGSDREGGGDGPMVVLLHGYGAPGTDLVPLWREIAVPEGTRFAFPEAPLELAILPGARAWWEIDIARYERAMTSGGDIAELTRGVPDGLAESRAKVIALLDALEREHAAKDIVLGGFSQGAMLALDVALRTDRPLAALVLMSATLIAADEWKPLMQKRAGLPVLQSHGRSDPLLPFFVAEQLSGLLKDAGLDTRFIAFNGGHTISLGVLDELGALVERVTKG